MPFLPILSQSNLESESAWHAYYRKVYGESAEDFDLNELTWFYNYAPCSATHITTTCTPKINESYRWCDTDLHVSNFFNVMNPERFLHSIGFFVNKAIVVPRAGDRVEILRVSDLEFGCAWFYIVKGSGIFITLPNAVLHHSRSFSDSTTFPSDTEIHNYMVSNGLDIMTIETSGRLAPIEMIMLQPWYHTGIASGCVASIEYSYGLKTPRCVRCSSTLYHTYFATLLIVLIAAIPLLKHRSYAEGFLLAGISLGLPVKLRPRQPYYSE